MKLRTVVLSTLMVGAVACATPTADNNQEEAEVKTTPAYAGEAVEHTFLELPYAYDALEPYIDAQTMELHYSKHHQGYFNNFKKAVAGSDLENASLHFIFENISTLSSTIRNNAGGYYNHNLFWSMLAPGGKGEPSEALLADINANFGSMEAFQEKFNSAATGQFGSGWSWLVVQADGKLAVTGTPNQDNPLMDVVEVNGTPILTLDVWEHAYYLKYQNKRGDYVQNFWNLVNWDEVNRRYAAAQ
ncbi:superoxide dismutase [Geofilum rubicundum]|uniref:Superoxide dismutase n=1 Tax=Geofilum rubicundum JCM 15548 TaxID=1236989 RepID=A0A0E9LVD7_9BACT|nr:superoxide dismutase [Geofilum rubicundum]GAO28835.1 manganese superoxide dismutase [Geofilum rubicundum JCM 15548]